MQASNSTIIYILSYLCTRCNMMHFRRLSWVAPFNCPICGQQTVLLSAEVVWHFTKKTVKFIFIYIFSSCNFHYFAGHRWSVTKLNAYLSKLVIPNLPHTYKIMWIKFQKISFLFFSSAEFFCLRFCLQNDFFISEWAAHVRYPKNGRRIKYPSNWQGKKSSLEHQLHIFLFADSKVSNCELYQTANRIEAVNRILIYIICAKLCALKLITFKDIRRIYDFIFKELSNSLNLYNAKRIVYTTI